MIQSNLVKGGIIEFLPVFAMWQQTAEVCNCMFCSGI